MSSGDVQCLQGANCPSCSEVEGKEVDNICPFLTVEEEESLNCHCIKIQLNFVLLPYGAT